MSTAQSSSTDNTPTSGGESVKSAARTVDILEVLSSKDGRMTLTELQRELSVPKSSLHGILRTLVAKGWVETDERGTAYAVGLRALRAGATFLDRDPIVQVAGTVLARLRTQYDETFHLARLDGNEVVYLASHESQHHLRVNSRIGRRLPAHATALGKALLAQRSWDEVTLSLPHPLIALTPGTITDREALRIDLERTRLRGWAHEIGENTPGLECLAVALPGAAAQDAISCSVPVARMTEGHKNEILAALIAAADETATLARSRA